MTHETSWVLTMNTLIAVAGPVGLSSLIGVI
jgi:hypothetical protein